MQGFAESGFTTEEGVLGKSAVRSLISSLEGLCESRKQRGGARNLLNFEAIQELARSESVRQMVEPVLGGSARAVRGILFDKTDDANWKVPWHQDVTIAVRHRVEIDGFGPWSIKEGVLHVQPPAYVLEKMLSLRLHLDDCPEENGALRVIPGSHLNGKMDAREIGRWVSLNDPFTCEMEIGGALLMRPLLLHASSASKIPRHRRVVHLDFAAAKLPSGMEWAQSSS